MKRRPHWDDDLTDAVFRALSHTYRAQGWTGGIAIDLDESVYPLIAAVEDWHEKFVMHGAFRVLAERAASAEADRDRLANQLLNEVPDSYIQMKARALTAEATIQRVRELHYNTATHHPSGCCSECGGTYPCPTVRAFDGGAE